MQARARLCGTARKATCAQWPLHRGGQPSNVAWIAERCYRHAQHQAAQQRRMPKERPLCSLRSGQVWPLACLCAARHDITHKSSDLAASRMCQINSVPRARSLAVQLPGQLDSLRFGCLRAQHTSAMSRPQTSKRRRALSWPACVRTHRAARADGLGKPAVGCQRVLLKVLSLNKKALGLCKSVGLVGSGQGTVVQCGALATSA